VISIKHITSVDKHTNPKSVLRVYFIVRTLLTWEQARLTHPPRTIADVTDKCSLTSTALYVLLLFHILSQFLLNRLVVDAPVDYDKCTCSGSDTQSVELRVQVIGTEATLLASVPT